MKGRISKSDSRQGEMALTSVWQGAKRLTSAANEVPHATPIRSLEGASVRIGQRRLRIRHQDRRGPDLVVMRAGAGWRSLCESSMLQSYNCP